MKKYALLVLLCFVSLLSYSQSFTIKVKDAVNKREMKDVCVCILDKDSVLLDSCQMISIMALEPPRYTYFSGIESNSPYFLIRCEKEGYITQTVRVERAEEIEPEPILMKRAPRTLREATVTGTKVMMVMKGDTIVYNASAFELAEGSMLDQLIARLPGVKLAPGGVITINGNRVSSLLIDGKDFFNGDANVALENLPAYMVSKVKSYQKIPNHAYLTRDDQKPRAEDPWVIDVNLKKEYHQGWLGNVEAGGGTEDKYLGRIFGLRFSDRSRVSLYGNANNTNSNQSPGREGNWENQDALTGEATLQKGGLFASIYGGEDPNRPIKFTTTLEAQHNKSFNESKTASTQFYQTGDTYSRSFSNSTDRQAKVKWESSLSVPTSFAYFSLEQYFGYSNMHNLGKQNSTTSTLEDLTLSSGWLNAYTDHSLGDVDNMYYSGTLNASIKMPHKQSLQVIASGGYNYGKNKGFSIYDLTLPQTEEADDYRNRHDRNCRRSYNLMGVLSYVVLDKHRGKLHHILTTNYHLDLKHENGGRDYYRLDRLENGWEIPGFKHLGQLPSTTDSLTLATDWANTFHTTTHSLRHKAKILYGLTVNGMEMWISLPLTFVRNSINDLRMHDSRNRVVKHYRWFNPDFSLAYKGAKLSGSMNREAPLMTYLLDVRDDSNPLSISLGNARLKPTDNYYLNLEYAKSRTKNAQHFNALLSYVLQKNAVAMMRNLNTETGVTAFMPENINGNWQTSAQLNYGRCLDSRQKWTLDVGAKATYYHSVDFQQTDGMETSTRSIVRNLFTQGQATLAYHCRLFNASFKALLDWQNATGKRADFRTINSLNQLYTLTNQWVLPWDMQIDTDLTCYVRSGYNDHSMNSNEWIWNLALAKRMLKNKSLTVKLSAHDILAQRSSITRTLNAQGRVETWHNVQPRYFMLSLIYRLSKQPKRE